MRNMKKFIAALLVLTMALAMTSVAFAYEEITLGDNDEGVLVRFVGSAWGFEKVVNNHGRNRSDVCIRKDSRAYAVARKGDWYKVLIPKRGVVGYDRLWFNKKYVKYDDAYDFAYIIFSSGGSGRSLPSDVYGTSSSLMGDVVKTTGKVNLRSGWSLMSSRKSSIRKGEKVTLTGKWGADTRYVVFFEVRYNNKKGYVSQEYLKNGETMAIRALRDLADE